MIMCMGGGRLWEVTSSASVRACLQSDAKTLPPCRPGMVGGTMDPQPLRPTARGLDVARAPWCSEQLLESAVGDPRQRTVQVEVAWSTERAI